MSSADGVEIPLIKATNETLKGYGYLINSYENSGRKYNSQKKGNQCQFTVPLRYRLMVAVGMDSINSATI